MCTFRCWPAYAIDGIDAELVRFYIPRLLTFSITSTKAMKTAHIQGSPVEIVVFTFISSHSMRY